MNDQQTPASATTNAQYELKQVKEEGREDTLKLREQKDSALTLEEIRAKGREDWLKLRQQQTRENTQDLHDRSADKDRDAKPDHGPEARRRG